MVITFNGTKRHCGKWQTIKSCLVKNKNNQLYDYLQRNIENGNFYPDEKIVQYFLINGVKITLDDLLNRYGIMGFDNDCKNYPEQINCYTDKLLYRCTFYL